MAGLFNLPSPQAVRQNARQGLFQQAQQVANAPRGRGAIAAATQAGGLFGELAGRALGGQAPGEDLAIRGQAVQQAVAQQVQEQGIDATNPDGFVQMAKLAADAFNRAGMPDQASQAAQQALAVQKQFAGKPADKFAAILDDKGSVVAQRNLKTNKVVSDPRAKKDPDTVINNNLGGDDEFQKAFSKEFGRDLVARRKDATDAKHSLQSSNTAVDLLNSGVITGTGANFIVGMGKALRRVGIDAFKDDVQNTEAFYANQAKQVAQIIKAFGAGTGLSDADREYAERAAAGKITMSEESIRRILDINQRASSNVIDEFNTDVGKIDNKRLPFDISIQKPILKNPLFDFEGIASPTTQEEFDALPSGAIFIDPDDGKKRRKP